MISSSPFTSSIVYEPVDTNPKMVLKDGQTLYLAVPWSHHFPVWAYGAGEGIDDWCIIRSNEKMMVAFASESSRDSFMNWWKRYQKRFPPDANISSTRFPSPPEGMISGTVVKTVNADKDWWWIAANTSANVYYLDGFWFFEKDTDAVLFRLRG